MKRPVGRPAKSDQCDTRGALLASAIDLFSANGFRAVELRAIARDAGVSSGLIRHHFGSKEDLIGAATVSVLETLTRAFHAMLAELEAPTANSLLDQMAKRTIEQFLPQHKYLFYLKHLSIERTSESLGAFQEYFRLVQSHLVTLDACGDLNRNVNGTWLCFLIMSMQFGPVFLNTQIQSIIGVSAFHPSAIEQRVRTNNTVLRHGMLTSDAGRRDLDSAKLSFSESDR